MNSCRHSLILQFPRCFLIPLLCLLVFLTPIDTLAQQNFQWRNFTRFIDGLSSNDVRIITEDRRGQLWLATSNGLSHFDGFWHAIDVSDNNPNANDVSNVLITSDPLGAADFIWVATNAGVYQGRIDEQNPARIDWQRHYTIEDGLISNRVLTMIERRSGGEIWIGTPRGANWFDGETWHPVPNAEGGLEQGVQTIYEDESGDLWFGLSPNNTPNRLSHFDGVRWQVFGINDGLPNGDVQAIAEDATGRLWIGTTGGVGIYDGLTWEVVTAFDFLIDNRVSAIMRDSEETVWVGTTSGVSLFDHGRWNQLTKANGLVSNNIQALFESRSGELWVGTRDGISFSDRSWKSFTSDDGLTDNRVTAMLTDGNGVIWVGTQNGLSQYTSNGIKIISGLPGNKIRALAEDLQGQIWVGTNAGLAVFDTTVAQTSPNEIFQFAVGTNDVQSIVADATGNIWVGTGIVLFGDSTIPSFANLSRYDGTQWEHNVFREIDRPIVVMFEDSRGRIYFGTAGDATFGSDLWVYDGAVLNKIEGLPNHVIHDIIEAPNTDHMWVGTLLGIQILDAQTLQPISRITTDDRLVDNRVQAIYRDFQDRIWIGTADGANLFQNGRFEQTLTASDGLNSNDVSTITQAVDGTLWFGSPDGGISRFNQETNLPTTRIIDGPTDGAIVGDTNVFFQFEGGDASTPTSELRYRYQLDNSPPTFTDEEGFKDEIRLTGLMNGRHRFIVLAIDREGNIDPVGVSAEFVVDAQPPIVSITSPKREAIIGRTVLIEGIATDESDFLEYQIRIFPGNTTSTSPIETHVSSQSVEVVDTLHEWNTENVPDGTYTIQLIGKDTKDGEFDREHQVSTSVTVTVDNTAPFAKITRPLPNSEISGTINVDVEFTDAHLASYQLEYAKFANIIDDWNALTSAPISGVQSSIQFRWDTSTVYGHIVLRARVEDAAGNTGTSEIIPLELRNEEAKPVVEIQQPDEVNPISGFVSIFGTVDVGKTEMAVIEVFTLEFRPIDGSDWQTIQSGRFSFHEELIDRWDTTDIPDGKYALRLSATDNSGYTSESEKEVTLDNTPPKASIASPADGTVLKQANIDIIGTATDTHFSHYELTFLGPEAGVIPPTGTPTQPVETRPLGDWNATTLPGGEYTLRLVVHDLAGLQSLPVEIRIILDDADVIAKITSPEENQFVSALIPIIGTVKDTDGNFDRYELRFRAVSGDEHGEISIPEPNQPIDNDRLATWETPQRDGLYEIFLSAFDLSDKPPSEDIVRVIVDNLPPQAQITNIRPLNGESPNTDVPSGEVEIIGTADDAHFSNFRLDFRFIDRDGDWEPILVENPAEPRRNETLAIWETPGIDGEYEIRLTVTDRSERDPREDFARVTIDNQQPQVEIIQPNEGQLVSKEIEIIGMVNDIHLVSYRLDFRSADGIDGWQEIGTFTEPKDNQVLAKWTPPQVEGEYEIRLTAQDLSGRLPVETIVRIIVDRFHPAAQITYPQENQQLPQKIEIIGTANDLNFEGYIIEYAPGEVSNDDGGWRKISKIGFRQAVKNDTLAEWTVPTLFGEYTLRLTVEDTAGNFNQDHVTVFFQAEVESRNGGLVKSEDEGAAIALPPNALLDRTVVTINPIPTQNVILQDALPLRYTGIGYDFAPENLRLHRLKPATIEFSISNAETVLTKDTFAIFREVGEKWTHIGGTINRQQGTISTAIAELGRYAVMVVPGDSNPNGGPTISRLTCQPRVFSPNRESVAISFQLNQPNTVTIKVYNAAGRLRRLLVNNRSLSSGTQVIWWDGRDDDQQTVVSNFYIITVEAEGAMDTKTVAVRNN